MKKLTAHMSTSGCHEALAVLTDISSLANSAQQLGRILVDVADRFDASDRAARDFRDKVLAIMEAVDRNFELIGETATQAEHEARQLAAAPPGHDGEADTPQQ